MRDWADPLERAKTHIRKGGNYLALADMVPGMRAKGATELAEAIDALREALATVQVNESC